MTKISVSLGATINLGDFNSMRIDYMEETDVAPDADLDEARDALYDRVETFVEGKVAEARED